MAVLSIPRILPSGGDAPNKGDYLTPAILHYKSASGDTNVDLFSKNAPFKFRVVSAWTVMAGAGTAADAAKLQRGDGATSEAFTDITDNLDLSAKADKALTYFGTLDDAQWDIARGESLRFVQAGAPASGMDLYVEIVPDPD